jgi:hypothetical protein
MKPRGRPSKAEEIKAKKITIETEDGEIILLEDKIVKVFKDDPDRRGRIQLNTGLKNKVYVIELKT